MTTSPPPQGKEYMILYKGTEALPMYSVLTQAHYQSSICQKTSWAAMATTHMYATRSPTQCAKCCVYQIEFACTTVALWFWF